MIEIEQGSYNIFCTKFGLPFLLNRRSFDFYVSELFILQFLVPYDNIETASLAKLADRHLKVRRSLVWVRLYRQSPN